MPHAEFTWRVPVDHPAFAGHFPGQPIVPGVLLLDRAILCAEALRGASPGVWYVTQVKFFSPVGPGETLLLQLREEPGGSLSFVVSVGDRTIATGRLDERP